MRYKTGYCFTSLDLYDNFNTNQLRIKKEYCKQKYKANNKIELCARVLTYLFYLIVSDIVKNNVTFELPLKMNRKACLYVKQFNGEKFKKMYRGGCFEGIDYFKTGFKGYQLTYQWDYGEGLREKPVYFDKKLKQILIDNVNNGKQYY